MAAEEKSRAEAEEVAAAAAQAAANEAAKRIASGVAEIESLKVGERPWTWVWCWTRMPSCRSFVAGPSAVGRESGFDRLMTVSS